MSGAENFRLIAKVFGAKKSCRRPAGCGQEDCPAQQNRPYVFCRAAGRLFPPSLSRHQNASGESASSSYKTASSAAVEAIQHPYIARLESTPPGIQNLVDGPPHHRKGSDLADIADTGNTAFTTVPGNPAVPLERSSIFKIDDVAQLGDAAALWLNQYRKAIETEDPYRGLQQPSSHAQMDDAAEQEKRKPGYPLRQHKY